MSDKKWDIMNEFSKSILTLAGGLLAVGATYFSQNNFSEINWVLVIIAGLLLLSVIGALLVAGNIFKYFDLKDNDNNDNNETKREVKKAKNRARSCANISYIALTLSLSLLIIFALKPSVKMNINDAVNYAQVNLAHVLKLDKDSLEFKSLVTDNLTKTFFITFANQNSDISYIVSYDFATKIIKSMRKDNPYCP